VVANAPIIDGAVTYTGIDCQTLHGQKSQSNDKTRHMVFILMIRREE
jgi:hypothetical protein